MPRQVNWTATLASTAFSEVVDVQFGHNAQVLTGKADLDLYPTAKRVVGLDPQFTVTTEDAKNVTAIPLNGTPGSFTATHMAASSTAADGVTYTLSNAICTDHSGGGGHAAWGRYTHRIEAYSTDGVTSPLTIGAAS